MCELGEIERLYRRPHVGFDHPRTCPRFGSGAEHDDRSDAWVDENKLPSGGGPGEVRLSQNVY
jgi:hypothetical protein